MRVLINLFGERKPHLEGFFEISSAIRAGSLGNGLGSKKLRGLIIYQFGCRKWSDCKRKKNEVVYP